MIENSETYDAIYGSQSNSWRKRRTPFYEKLASFILPTDNVLDIGCGNGLLALQSKWNSYIGIDFSNVAISQAKNFCPKATFICEDVSVFLNYNSVNYDTIVMTEFLEHIEDDISIISKIKNGSKIIISVPNNEKIINGKPKGYPIHKRAYTLESFSNRYESIKFSTVFVFMDWIIGVGIKLSSKNIIKNLNNYFDKIYCINLNRRIDRWKRISKMFLEYNVDVQRIEAFDGQVIGSPNKLRPSQYGCLLSHKFVYEDAVKNNYGKILILEDDAYFDKNINSYDFTKLPEWDVLYLGASQAPNTNIWDVEMKDGYYLNNKNTLGTFGIAFKLDILIDILKTMRENITDEPIDVVLPKYIIEKKCSGITIFPNIIIPDVRDSDICNTNDQIAHSKRMKWNLENFDII